MPRQSVCLSMIVKDEAPVIAACLASVLPVIDYWIICDTGSTDGTQQVVRDFFAKHGKPGELHQTAWRDFAFNRTEALDLARPHGDYTLIIDADDVLVLPRRFRLPHLTADSYTFEIHHLELRYLRAQLVRSALPWRYEGVLHEFLSYADPNDGGRVFSETKNQRSLPGVQIHMGHGGARRRTDAATRYARDAAVLQHALTTETDPFLVARYTFYLAQSLNDSGKKEEAVEIYRRRAKLGFWQQEVYISLYEVARIKATLGRPPAEVMAAFRQAAAADPTRAEAFHGAARYCRENGRYEDGYKFAEQALRLRQPAGALFAEPWVYEYGLLDEFAVNAYWVGDYEGCLKACRRLLSRGKRLPQEHRPRVEANAKLAREKLQQRRHVPQTVNGGYVREVESAATPELADAETSTGSAEIDVADVQLPPKYAGAEQHPEGRSAASEPQTQLMTSDETGSPAQPNLALFGEESFVAQHALSTPRNLHSVSGYYPRVLIAILAKQKEEMLPLYLRCIESLDYPKSAIVLYVRTNNNTDRTAEILREWLDRNRNLYSKVEFDNRDVEARVERFGVHEWNVERFSVLAHIRQISLEKTSEHGCAYYFVSDVDNFVRPETLKELVALNLPIVAPFLRTVSSVAFYSNYHADIDRNGYYRSCDQYQWILNRWVRGVVELPLIHCTYLVRADVIPMLYYEDGSSRYEYVIFAESARKAEIPQYLDNRQVYGYIAFGQGASNHTPNGIEIARSHLFPE